MRPLQYDYYLVESDLRNGFLGVHRGSSPNSGHVGPLKIPVRPFGGETKDDESLVPRRTRIKRRMVNTAYQETCDYNNIVLLSAAHLNSAGLSKVSESAAALSIPKVAISRH